MKKTVSIVIPAFNEERYLPACLDSIAAQTETPDEVIVVDNNSTDRTAAIARSYPFVTVLHEHEQGFTPPRNRGFNAAKGDIIGRINANAVLSPDWVRLVKANFAKHEHLGGVCGLAATHFLPRLTLFRVRFISHWYLLQSEAYFHVRLLWGANMAISAVAWRDVRDATCRDDSLVHDDQDLSLLLASHGWLVTRNSQMIAGIAGDDYFSWPKFKNYMHRRWHTKAYHKRRQTLTASTSRVLPAWQCRLVWILLWVPFGLFAVSSYACWVVWRVGQLLYKRSAPAWHHQ